MRAVCLFKGFGQLTFFLSLHHMIHIIEKGYNYEDERVIIGCGIEVGGVPMERGGLNRKPEVMRYQ